MIAGCYTLELYCENYKAGVNFPDEHGHKWDEFPWTYSHELGSRCRAKARKAGWKLLLDGTAFCPKCNKRSNDQVQP